MPEAGLSIWHSQRAGEILKISYQWRYLLQVQIQRAACCHSVRCFPAGMQTCLSADPPPAVQQANPFLEVGLLGLRFLLCIAQPRLQGFIVEPLL